jgi:hypothetical protein
MNEYLLDPQTYLFTILQNQQKADFETGFKVSQTNLLSTHQTNK